MSDVTVVGNIGGEPELRFSKSGTPVLSFSLAEGHRKRDGNEWVDDGTTWRRVTVWEAKAETLAEALGKGMRVIVVGSERLREYETQDGKGKSLEITAKNVGIVPKAQGGSQAQQQAWGGQQHSDPWGAPAGDTPPF